MSDADHKARQGMAAYSSIAFRICGSDSVRDWWQCQLLHSLIWRRLLLMLTRLSRLLVSSEKFKLCTSVSCKEVPDDCAYQRTALSDRNCVATTLH